MKIRNPKLLFLIVLTAIVSETLWALPAQKAVNKEENVYVLSDTEGNVNKIIVSAWLKNPEKKKELTDISDLKDITNVKGDETFKEKNGKKIWAANGNDIFYQGTTDKEVPVSISISYKLNGKKISAQDLAGKNGKVTIRFDYKPNVYETVVVDGKKCKITPAFLVMSGVLLDNENFRNIKVNTGKIINDGNRSIVIGVALPGMQENLGLSKKDFDIPSFVEITADATDFSLITMMSLASNDAISSLNLDQLNSSNDLSNMISSLTEKLNEGIDELYDGVNQLNQGMGQLSSGLSLLSKNSPALTDGAMQVFQALFDTAEKTFGQNHIKIEKLTVENYHQVLEPVAEKLILKKDKKQVLDLIESLDNYKKFYDGIVAYTNGVNQCYEGSILLAEGTDQLYTAVTAVKHGSTELAKGIANFQDDSLSILNGMQGFDIEILKKLANAVSKSETVLSHL
ncbi:MAG: hypothetical protein IKZ86_00125, partial [Spirochaetaceae bacterium]|nr:hypothetical protein [Spirochaetaceae bacterium]